MATRSEFAASVKAKYPQYANVDDSALVDRMLEKYPQYRDRVTDDAPAATSPETMEQPPEPQKPGMLTRAWGGLGRTMDRISAAPLRGAQEAIQNYEPEGDGAFHPGVLGAAAKGAWRGVTNPDEVQPAEKMFERMGASTEPSSPLSVYGTSGKPMNLGADRPEKDPSLASTFGAIQDLVAPGPPIAAIARSAVKAGEKGADLAADAGRAVMNSPGMRKAAEKAVLDNYAPRFRAEFAPPDPTPGTIKNASADLAGVLKESDLLRSPEKAKINLNAGLNKVGGAIEKTVQKATEADVSVNVKEVVQNYATTTRNVLRKTGKNAAEIEEIEGKVLPKIQKIIDNLGPDEMGNIPVDKGVEFRRALQNMVKSWDGENRNVAQLVAKKLSGSMNEKIIASHPEFGPRLAMLNDRYSALKDAEEMIQEGYQKAYAKASGVALNDRGVPLTKQGFVDRVLQGAMNPRESLMKLRPELAERVANDGYLPYGGSSPLPDNIPRPPTVGAEDVAALKAPFLPEPKGLAPRTPTGRTALNKPAEYVPRQGEPPAPPRRVISPQYERRPLEYDGDMGVEALGDVRAAEQAQPPLPPRQPVGNIPSNFPQQVPENPKFSKVLNEAGRRPLVVNKAKIDALKSLLKQDIPKARKQEIKKAIREENYKIPLSSQISPSHDAFLKVLQEADGWPKGINEQKVQQLVESYKNAKMDAQKVKIMAALRKEWDAATQNSNTYSKR